VTWVGGIYDDTAALDLYKGAGLDRAIAGGLTNNTRRYDWVIPMDVTPGSDYRVRVTLNGAAGADSAAFTVNPAFVDLAVGSPYGVTDPATGVTSYAYGSMVTGAVLNSPVMLTDEQGRVSLVCTGWVGTGSAPVAGEGTNLVFSITEDSSLDWLWAVQDLVMSNRTVTGSVVTQALDSITAGDGYRVDPGGDVTFEAGRLIRLVPGFEAATGSVFRARTP
jgi:hypothetical protein